MNYLLIFILGFVAAAIGTAPPGLLNMTAGKIAFEQGVDKSNRFVIGASSVSLLYCLIATQFSAYIDSYPDFISIIYKVGALIFGILTIYFFYKGWQEQRQLQQVDKQRNNFYLTGVFLSLLNILPLPFYTAIVLLLAKKNVFHFEIGQVVIITIGAALGTASVLKMYAVFYPKVTHKRTTQKPTAKRYNANYIVAIVTFCVMLTAIFNILLKSE